MKFFWVVLFLVGSAASAVADDVCSFDVFRPEAVLGEIRASLPGMGIAELPSAIPVFGLPPERLSFLRSSAVVGQVSLLVDERTGSADVRFYDSHNRLLAHGTERTFVCLDVSPPGKCQELTFSTEQDETTAVTAPPFSVLRRLGDVDGTYSRYGTPVSASVFREDFFRSVTWLKGVLFVTDKGYPLPQSTPRDRIFAALASDPEVSRYMNRLTFFPNRGYWVIRGVVPSNYLYGRVIDLVRATGVTVYPDLIIDTRIVAPVVFAPLISGCFAP